MVATLIYPPPLEAARDAAMQCADESIKADVETPILISGGGPVGMMQALILARIHKQKCMLIERSTTTTVFPKMEWTNGRSMEIYRALGLHEKLRKVGAAEVPEHYSNDETIVTSLLEGGKLVDIWRHLGAAGQRERSQSQNDGSQYLEPHMRCHQIILEKWLKEQVEAEPLIECRWGTAFVGLHERNESVMIQMRDSTGIDSFVKSKYVIGADGGGSWVRKAAGLESKRNYLNLTVAFVHFRSAGLRKLMPFPRAWHANVIGGGVLVSQNENDLWTCHYMVPPNMDAHALSDDDILGLTLGGCQGSLNVPYEEVYCRGVWRTDVAIADSFISRSGRVLLAGDAAHQLSPIGGHGLNSGIGDVFDLGWKLSAVLQGWAGKSLLSSYNDERRKIALENLDHVQEGLETVIVPIFAAPVKYGAEVVNGDGDDAEKVRAELVGHCRCGQWLHEQHGNILGMTYKDSPIVHEKDESTGRPMSHNENYVPTTYPGSRAPHVWMVNGKSTLDAFSHAHFNLIDFSDLNVLSQPFVRAAEELRLPLQLVSWDKSTEANVRKVYERDLVLLRPDGFVAWRSPSDDQKTVTYQQAVEILGLVSGR